MVILKHILPFSPQADDAEEMKVCKANEEQPARLFLVQNLNTLSQVTTLGVWVGPVVQHTAWGESAEDASTCRGM